jgi:hypothetical protein
MDEFLESHKRLHVEEAVHSLQKHGFEAQFFQTRDEAVRFINNEAENCQQ